MCLPAQIVKKEYMYSFLDQYQITVMRWKSHWFETPFPQSLSKQRYINFHPSKAIM